MRRRADRPAMGGRFPATSGGTSGVEAMSSPAVQQQPFLPRRALLGLALVAPLITLVTLPLSEGASFSHQVVCLLAQWVGALLVGGGLHVLVNATARRLGVVASTALAQA